MKCSRMSQIITFQTITHSDENLPLTRGWGIFWGDKGWGYKNTLLRVLRHTSRPLYRTKNTAITGLEALHQGQYHIKSA